MLFRSHARSTIALEVQSYRAYLIRALAAPSDTSRPGRARRRGEASGSTAWAGLLLKSIQRRLVCSRSRRRAGRRMSIVGPLPYSDGRGRGQCVQRQVTRYEFSVWRTEPYKRPDGAPQWIARVIVTFFFPTGVLRKIILWRPRTTHREGLRPVRSGPENGSARESIIVRAAIYARLDVWFADEAIRS